MGVTKYEGRRTKKRSGGIIIVAVLAVCIVIFAFIWEFIGNRPPDIPDYFSPPPSDAQSGVQAMVDRLDWVTADFLPINEYSRPGEALLEVNAIVIHYVGNPSTTARQNRNYFSGLAASGEAYLSSNFIVGLDGEILQCVPVDEVAYASNTRNNDTISIECCHPDETGEFTADTYDSAVKLTAWLCFQFDLTEDDIIRHYDITGKECPKYYVENEDEWSRFKGAVALELGEIALE